MALDMVFHKIHVEDVVIPRTDGRSRGYAFVTLSWAEASEVDPSDICTIYSGMLFHDVKSRQISLVELVEQQPATRCVVSAIPAGSALKVWPWTSVLNSLVG